MRSVHAYAFVATSVVLWLPGSPAAAAATTQENAPLAAAGNVVVNEFAPTAAIFFDEFVELFNTGSQSVSVGGWELLACLSDNTLESAFTFPGGSVIAPGEHVLLAHPDWAGIPAPDGSYEVDVPADGGWLLVDSTMTDIDGVGLDDGLPCTERDPAPQCDWAAGATVSRDAQGTDTDDNSADFTCQQRTPGR